MSIKYVAADNIPSSPLNSQGIIAGDFLFTSGQIGLNNTVNKMEDMTFKDEFIQSLEKIKSILESAKFDLDDIVKVTIFITDINYYDSLNNIYLNYFPNHKPARSCVVVASLAKGARVEVEAIAYRGKGGVDSE